MLPAQACRTTSRALTMCLFQTKNGPLFGGNDVNGLDMMLGPQLKHTMIACKTIKVSAWPLGLMWRPLHPALRLCLRACRP